MVGVDSSYTERLSSKLSNVVVKTKVVMGVANAKLITAATLLLADMEPR